MVILDGYLVGYGSLSWEPISRYGELTVYDMTEEDRIAERIGDADAVFVNRCPISAKTMKQCPELRFISTFGTGYNTIDLHEAKRRGITVCNIPAYGQSAVAQMAMALLFEIARNTSKFDRYVKEKGWVSLIDPDCCGIPQMELSGKTMGILGMGDIGYAVAQIAMAMDMRVLATRRRPDPALESARLRFVSLDELLAGSDVVSIHCPLTDETRGLIDKSAIAKMKDGAILINTSRGAVLNEADVVAALDAGKLYAVGATSSPTSPPAESPAGLPSRCVAAPHMAWAPVETRLRLIDTAAKNLGAFLAKTAERRRIGKTKKAAPRMRRRLFTAFIYQTMTFCGAPESHLSMLSNTMTARLTIDSLVAKATCGVATTLGAPNSGCAGSMGGSPSKTSMPAPASFLSLSACAKAALSTTGPLAALMSSAVGFMSERRSALMSPLVLSPSGTCSEIMSQAESSVSRSV
jgi:glycerate dehydrogenase